MRQVAEENASVRVIAHILNNRAAIREAMRLPQIVRRGIGKAFEEQRLDTGVPRRIDDRFMRKHRIGLDRNHPDEQSQQQQPTHLHNSMDGFDLEHRPLIQTQKLNMHFPERKFSSTPKLIAKLNDLVLFGCRNEDKRRQAIHRGPRKSSRAQYFLKTPITRPWI